MQLVLRYSRIRQRRDDVSVLFLFTASLRTSKLWCGRLRWVYKGIFFLLDAALWPEIRCFSGLDVWPTYIFLDEHRERYMREDELKLVPGGHLKGVWDLLECHVFLLTSRDR